MGSKDPIPVITEWIKFPWEKDPVAPLTIDEVAQIQAEMAAYNNSMNK